MIPVLWAIPPTRDFNQSYTMLLSYTSLHIFHLSKIIITTKYYTLCDIVFLCNFIFVWVSIPSCDIVVSILHSLNEININIKKTNEVNHYFIRNKMNQIWKSYTWNSKEREREGIQTSSSRAVRDKGYCKVTLPFSSPSLIDCLLFSVISFSSTFTLRVLMWVSFSTSIQIVFYLF